MFMFKILSHLFLSALFCVTITGHAGSIHRSADHSVTLEASEGDIPQTATQIRLEKNNLQVGESDSGLSPFPNIQVDMPDSFVDHNVANNIFSDQPIITQTINPHTEIAQNVPPETGSPQDTVQNCQDISPSQWFKDYLAERIQESLQPLCEIENQLTQKLYWAEDQASRATVSEVETKLDDFYSLKEDLIDSLLDEFLEIIARTDNINSENPAHFRNDITELEIFPGGPTIDINKRDIKQDVAERYWGNFCNTPTSADEKEPTVPPCFLTTPDSAPDNTEEQSQDSSNTTTDLSLEEHSLKRELISNYPLCIGFNQCEPTRSYNYNPQSDDEITSYFLDRGIKAKIRFDGQFYQDFSDKQFFGPGEHNHGPPVDVPPIPLPFDFHRGAF